MKDKGYIYYKEQQKQKCFEKKGFFIKFCMFIHPISLSVTTTEYWPEHSFNC